MATDLGGRGGLLTAASSRSSAVRPVIVFGVRRVNEVRTSTSSIPTARCAFIALLDTEMIWRVILVSVLFAFAVFGVFFFWTQTRGDTLAYTRTLVVNLFVVLEIFYLFSVRYLHLTALTWVGVLDTPAVHAVVILAGVVLLVVLEAEKWLRRSRAGRDGGEKVR